MQKEIRNLKVRELGRKWSVKGVVIMVVMTSMLLLLSLNVFASTPAPSLNITFDTEQMFTWAQTIINAMMPVVYIIMGVGLGFIVIRAFKSAFN